MRIKTEEVNQAYDRLPDNLKEVFNAEETATALMDIGKKYALHIDQTGELASLVHYILLGFLAPKDFTRELKNTVGISEDIANLITYDINQQIFSKIRKELEELSQVQDDSSRGLPSGNLRGVLGTASALQVFDEKMRGVANVPKQEVVVAPQTKDNKTRDPYREYVGNSM